MLGSFDAFWVIVDNSYSASISWVIWREVGSFGTLELYLTIMKVLAEVFELMRDGDVDGLWKIVSDKNQYAVLN